MRSDGSDIGCAGHVVPKTPSTVHDCPDLNKANEQHVVGHWLVLLDVHRIHRVSGSSSTTISVGRSHLSTRRASQQHCMAWRTEGVGSFEPKGVDLSRNEWSGSEEKSGSCGSWDPSLRSQEPKRRARAERMGDMDEAGKQPQFDQRTCCEEQHPL